MHKRKPINQENEILSANSVKSLLLPLFERYGERIKFAYLFGSAARKDAAPFSDIDIAVFLSGGTRKFYSETRLSIHADLCRMLKRNDIDLLILNTALNIILLDEIIRHGVVLYDIDTNLREEFELKILHQVIDFKDQRYLDMGL
jgi:predicted nucleotidyltransferase